VTKSPSSKSQSKARGNSPLWGENVKFNVRQVTSLAPPVTNADVHYNIYKATLLSLGGGQRTFRTISSTRGRDLRTKRDEQDRGYLRKYHGHRGEGT